MEFLITWLKNLFNPSRWTRRFSTYQRRVEHKVREKTVGRMDAKIYEQEKKLDDKVWKAQDKVLERKDNQKK